MKENFIEKEMVYKIIHHYNYSPEFHFKVVSKQNPLNAALYIQLFAEKVFGDDICLDNIAIADALIKFYDCRLPTDEEFCQPISDDYIIDMYSDRENLFCNVEHYRNKYHKIMETDTYSRTGLKEYLESIQKDGDYCGDLNIPIHYVDFEKFKSLSNKEQQDVFDKMRDNLRDFIFNS